MGRVLKKMFFMLLLVIFISLYSFSFLEESSKYIEGTYYGNWGRTSWIYKFDKEKRFSRETTGHFGFTNISGLYEIIGDTIILNSTTSLDRNASADIKNQKFLIYGDSCLTDLDIKYFYCK